MGLVSPVADGMQFDIEGVVPLAEAAAAPAGQQLPCLLLRDAADANGGSQRLVVPLSWHFVLHNHADLLTGALSACRAQLPACCVRYRHIAGQ